MPMSRILLAMLVALALVPAPASAQNTTVTLMATDSKSINPAGSNWNDNRLRAYYNSSTGPVDGFVKFNLSSIPDTAAIVRMVLTTYHEEGFGNPWGDPQVRIYRVAVDTWARGQNDPYPGLNEVLTPTHSGFPSGNLISWDWDLDVNAANWSVDLVDNVLSLGMHNLNTVYSAVYWYGSDTLPAPPRLEIEYTSFVLAATGSCPGPMSFTTTNGTAGGTVAFTWGSAGTFTIPGGKPCVGTELDLVPLLVPPPGYKLATANGAGSATLGPISVPGAGCGLLVQAVDLATCTVSNTVVL